MLYLFGGIRNHDTRRLERAGREKANTLGGYIYTRSEYNAKGQLVKQYQDTGWNTSKTAATLYEYDGFGNLSKQTLALADAPTKDNSPVVEMAYSVEAAEDGVFSVTTQTRYNAAGEPLSTSQKQLISQFSPTIENKLISISERGLTSTQWSTYNTGTKRTSYSNIPTSTITAETVTVDGFVVSQTDNTGITSSAARAYATSGMTITHTDGRGNPSTTATDIAGRAILVTDAAGNSTSTTYCTCCDQPATVTDAQGNTSCYRYDERGRKIAEWGTGIQPVCYAYDSADRLVSLTTFRVTDENISSDPTGRTDGDTTTWSYHDASGMETSKTYADGKGVTKTYDAYNRLLTETDGRGVVKTHSYEQARGLLLGTIYSDSTTARSYSYNHLGQLTQVVDDAGTRTIGYNAYNEQESDSLLAGGKTHLVTELRDDYGRSSGYTYANNGSVQQTVSTGYGSDGRIASAGFVHGGAQKLFTYSYLPGTNLLQTLVKPNNMTLTQSYEEKRDLLIGQLYKRSNTSVASRAYTYDTLGRPMTRSTSKDGSTVNDSFGYNSRSELNTATVNNAAYAYDYDNIGNRETAQEAAESATSYESNNLNQYTAIGDFEPTYDDAGNQTKVKTSTGIWTVVYNAENRPTSFTNADSGTVVECTYDYMGRRATKKVTVNGSVTLHQRYLYRGYLQIACCDLTRSNHPCLWLITWDPSQPVATRPLAIQKDGTWYTYGWDLTKNICEVYGQHGYIRTNYSYSPYGEVTISGDVTQPIQWSSEYSGAEIDLVYYNYRHYSPQGGRWIGRDNIETPNLYKFGRATIISEIDILGNLWWLLGGSQRQEVIECTKADCEAYKDMVLQTHKKTIATLKKQGCSLQVVCVSSINIPRPDGRFDVYTGPKATTLYSKNNDILMMINYSKFANMNSAINQKLFEHELVHAFDLCKYKHYPQSCHEAIKYEVRAYNRGGGNCETLTGEARINCVINRTISNLFASEGAANIGKCKNYTKEYVRSYIRKNYHTIIKGMPF